jgi:hypothetical protein
MLAALLLSVVPFDLPHEQRCDWIELNHFYDCGGNHVFSQWIFWDWSGYRKQVAGWRLVRPATRKVQDGVLLYESDSGKFIRVRCRDCRETWTQFDPEVADRDILPDRDRRGIR